MRILVCSAVLAACAAPGPHAAAGLGKGPSKQELIKKYTWECQKRKRPYREVLEHINKYRKLAKVDPLELDEKLCMAAQQHADYLVRNKLRLMHRQSPIASGYVGREFTDRIKFFGGEGGAFECISSNADFGKAVDGHISSVYHRLPFLNPRYDRVGLGIAGNNTVADFGRGRRKVRDEPVVYPANGQKGVTPHWLVNESPNPVEKFGNPKIVGYPISARFNGPIDVVSARLSCPGEEDVPVFVLSRNNDGMKLLRNEIFLLAKKPMKPLTGYSVALTVKVKGVEKNIAWSFTTSSEPLPGEDGKNEKDIEKKQ